MEQEEEAAAGVYQVRACQEAVNQAAMGQRKKTGITEVEEKASESDGILLEGEEQEYFLELLMRIASPERPKTSQPAKGKEKKTNRKKERKALRKNAVREETGERAEKERVTSQADGLKKQPAPDIVNNPEAKGRGLVGGDQEKKEQVTRPQATSGGECSGQETPDSS
jgi:hypothetical protein